MNAPMDVQVWRKNKSLWRLMIGYCRMPDGKVNAKIWSDNTFRPDGLLFQKEDWEKACLKSGCSLLAFGRLMIEPERKKWHVTSSAQLKDNPVPKWHLNLLKRFEKKPFDEITYEQLAVLARREIENAKIQEADTTMIQQEFQVDKERGIEVLGQQKFVGKWGTCTFFVHDRSRYIG